ncbi:MAG TPA: NTP transferase domain-containing protein [Candidatus Dormibacteraeota bacterium]|nr:NTP transferase domain-containing protein [Candidatus Dormibacteraeota bacterium]
MNEDGRPRVAGIVLAGGRSRRFGEDKLGLDVGGVPLLDRAVAAVAGVADEVVVVVGAGQAEPDLRRLDRPPRVVHDPVPDQGPLVGLVAGLRSADAPVAVVVGGDMPFVAPAVLGLLVDALGTEGEGGGTPGGAATLALLQDSEAATPLPCALRVRPSIDAAERLLETGARSLRSLTGPLVTATIDQATWRRLDPDGLTLVDVDTPDDLRALGAAREARVGRRAGPGRGVE